MASNQSPVEKDRKDESILDKLATLARKKKVKEGKQDMVK